MDNNRSLNILIIEDSVSFSLELEMLVQEIGHEVIANVDNSVDAFDVLIGQEEVHLILMDIDIKGDLSGIEIAKKIQHLDIPILFITSYSDQETYQQALEVSPVGYIVKPLDKISIQSAIQLAVKGFTPSANTDEQRAISLKNYFFLKEKGVYKKVHIDSISYIEANGDYISFILDNKKKVLIRERLVNIERALPENKFIKVHRSFIVHLNKIEEIDLSANTINVQNTNVPISRSKKEHLVGLLNRIG